MKKIKNKLLGIIKPVPLHWLLYAPVLSYASSLTVLVAGAGVVYGEYCRICDKDPFRIDDIMSQ